MSFNEAVLPDMRAHGRFVLDGRVPRPEPSLQAWADWMETTERRVQLSELHRPGLPVATVETHFTGWDFYRDGGKGAGPMFFVTIVNLVDQAPRFSRTWDEATVAHEATCSAVWGVRR